MDQTTMTVLADEVVKGHRVVTFHSVYKDKILSKTPYRTEVVLPGEFLPSHGMNHATEEEALKAHREQIAEITRS